MRISHRIYLLVFGLTVFIVAVQFQPVSLIGLVSIWAYAIGQGFINLILVLLLIEFLRNFL